MIAITGATGALGGRVARLLADRSPTLVVRDPARAPDLGGEVRQASYDDRAAAEAALAGVTTLLLVS
ncbi:NAD(P)H-binding protein, partial [Nocardioides pelophilus]|uniref:NAD(P)H-binding protein n=1 Tax=Nocardioides pelophilus TaxID=2172019 RepID=UPI0016023552